MPTVTLLFPLCGPFLATPALGHSSCDRAVERHRAWVPSHVRLHHLFPGAGKAPTTRGNALAMPSSLRACNSEGYCAEVWQPRETLGTYLILHKLFEGLRLSPRRHCWRRGLSR